MPLYIYTLIPAKLHPRLHVNIASLKPVKSDTSIFRNPLFYEKNLVNVVLFDTCTDIYDYRQVSNIKRTSVGN